MLTFFIRLRAFDLSKARVCAAMSAARPEKVIFQSVNNHNNISYANQNEKFTESFSFISAGRGGNRLRRARTDRRAIYL